LCERWRTCRGLWRGWTPNPGPFPILPKGHPEGVTHRSVDVLLHAGNVGALWVLDRMRYTNRSDGWTSRSQPAYSPTCK